ncbi:C-type mannose receptor 2-like [Gasterosteus aculeatus]
MDGGWKKLLFFGSVCVLLQVAHQAGKSSSAKTDGVKLSGTLFSPQTVSDYQYILMKGEYDWMTASSYCSEHYQGLATITTQENITRINSLMKPYPTRGAWIGLYDDVSGWKWSQPDEGVTAGAQEEFWNWQQGQPDNNGSDKHCVSMTAGGLWRDNSCTLVNLPFVCFNASSVDPYTLVFEGMSWVEAQKFCRLHETDLASVRSLKESEEIQNILKENMEVWIGLHRDSWNWSDDTNFSFSSWSDEQPDNDVNPEACVSMLNGGWNDTLCSTRLYFICQGIPIASTTTTTTVQPVVQRRTTTVKMKLMSNADLEDPAVSDDLLRQFAAALKSQGVTDVKLTWKTLRKEPQPTKRGGK